MFSNGGYKQINLRKVDLNEGPAKVRGSFRSIDKSYGKPIILYNVNVKNATGSLHANVSKTELGYDLSVDGIGVFSVDLNDIVTFSIPASGDYILPPATEDTLGGVKIGSGLSADDDGTLSVNLPYAGRNQAGIVRIVGDGLTIESGGALSLGAIPIPVASTDVTGSVRIGDGIEVREDGIISVPLATDESVGLVRVGEGLTIDDSGTLDVVPNDPPIASDTVAGVVKVGEGLTIDESGLLNATASDPPIASDTVAGVVKVGNGLSIDGSGVLSATGGGVGGSTDIILLDFHSLDFLNIEDDTFITFTDGISDIVSAVQNSSPGSIYAILTKKVDPTVSTNGEYIIFYPTRSETFTNVSNDVNGINLFFSTFVIGLTDVKIRYYGIEIQSNRIKVSKILFYKGGYL